MNPLSSAYGALVTAKNRLYDAGVLKTQSLRGPVISVGNLSVGGSGKTPFVILLGELLKQHRIAFDVISRGYGRKTRGVLEVDPNGLAEQFGDEPLLIARRLGCSVIVGASRYAAGLYAEKKHGVQVHILDDGFQHRTLARDFDIVLLTEEDLHDQLLPAGRLREPLASLDRADTIVISSEMDFSRSPSQPIWRLQRSVEVANPPKRAVVFCGIARPHKFVEQLQAAGIRPASTRFYRDHHGYTSSDIRDLKAMRDRADANGFITTEKDSINLGPQVESLGAVTIARVRVELANADAALDTILGVIRDRKPAT